MPPYDFDFRRLGPRVSAWLVSPWVARGSVFQRPAGPTTTSQFELSSIPATVKNLFNLSGFLTKRDKWAGSFDELLLDTPRTDAPMHLPDGPPMAHPWNPPLSGGRVRIWPDDGDDDDEGSPLQHGGRRAQESHVNVTSFFAGPVPGSSQEQHCSAIAGSREDQPCAGLGTPSLKQRRNIRLFAHLTSTPEPDIDALTWANADKWLTDRWREWMQK
jgi:hypothetical protein